ncbi:protealysin inhibitor emfourin [Blastococcus sp. URHD0036]|uniref:protealysin inhibitor emfourin n=1 Tax=Blastococcus sp. URHD0036 TaxID=1380356 RepID=UPI0004972C88|nr:protealysin inhibitor emfourin [Blastococcus sp. URHD0036]
MKVTLETHGGLAGGLRLGGRPVVLDAARLPEDDARTLGDLVAAARAEPAPQSARRSAPDAMSYTVTVEDGSASDVLHRSDDGMTPAFAALLDWLGGREPVG